MIFLRMGFFSFSSGLAIDAIALMLSGSSLISSEIFVFSVMVFIMVYFLLPKIHHDNFPQHYVLLCEASVLFRLNFLPLNVPQDTENVHVLINAFVAITTIKVN